MKKLATAMILAATASLTVVAAAGPAAAATYRHEHRHHWSGPGHYEGSYEYRIDRNDHASSPYAGGVG